jgi:hypothetical protein
MSISYFINYDILNFYLNDIGQTFDSHVPNSKNNSDLLFIWL